MELIFVWVKDFYPFQDAIAINLSNRFSVTPTFNEERAELQLKVESTPYLPEIFFGERVTNVTAIIGKNGTGKTSLIDCLIEILESREELWYSLPSHVALYFDETSRAFSLNHNLFQHEHWDKKPVSLLFKGTSLINISLSLPGGYERNDELIQAQKAIVYFSPIFDLKDFPVRFDNKKIYDVSTNFLLISDAENAEKEQNPISVHRFKNVERQVKFCFDFQDKKELTNRFSIPEGMDVSCIELWQGEGWGWNLSPSSKSIREYFLGDEDPKNLGVIMKDIREYNSKLHEFEQANQRETEKYKQTKIERVKLFFLFEFANHFFSSMNVNGYWLNLEIGVEEDSFAGKSTWEAFKYFMQNQKWGYPDTNQAAFAFVESIENLITLEIVFEVDTHEDRTVRFRKTEDAFELMNKQFAYLNSLPIQKLGSPKDFLYFDWRNLSSGEKAFLDLFSRLHFAATEMTRKTNGVSEVAEFVYLFFDEGEIGFHPEWQREYLLLLLDVLPLIFKKQKIQVILSSHSPFVVSDLPKRNVVFLKSNSGNLTEIDSGVYHENTFAANIHTLLSDGFFMENGLLGAFAQEKIKSALEDIEEGNPERKEGVRRLISLIGEPVIRHKMEQFFFEKFGHKIDEESVDDRILRLERELESAKNSKNKEK